MQTPTDFEVPRHEIDREISAMPALGTLQVGDLARARA